MSPKSQTLCVFAARYAHDRPTAAAHSVVAALKEVWHALSAETRHQILSESEDASHNQDDWERLREFADGFDHSQQATS